MTQQLLNAQTANMDEIETQGMDDPGDENFRFDMQRVPQRHDIPEEKKQITSHLQQRSNTERLHEDDIAFRSPVSTMTRRGQAVEDQASENKVISPSVREEVKAMQQY